MNLCIDSQSASVHCQPESLDTLVDRLERLGYEPLLRKAAHHFSSVFNSSAEDLLQSEEDEDVEEAVLQFEDRRRRLLHLEKLGYSWGFDSLRSQARVPEIKGELFFSDDDAGLLFVTMVEISGARQPGRENDTRTDTTCKLRVGFIGDVDEKAFLRDLVNSMTKILDEMGIHCEWQSDDVRSLTYQELARAGRDGNLLSATTMTEKELRAARALENTNVREVAGLVRRAGVMLAKELLRQKADQASDIIRHVDQLLQVDLAHQEYVVVCSKTGSHVNRVETRDVIDQMARLGVLCSCGKPISDEQIEGLLAADALLPKMLDKNYWMAAMVVRVLNSLDIPSERILINTNPTGEDVEIFADVDGTLIMVELKDIEFGLSQAYSLGTRIGVHRPQIAIVVSTRGISSDVKEHFKRIKAETQMVYVANLLQMEAVVKKVVETVRTTKVKAWLNYFQGLLTFPLASLMIPKLSTGSSFESPHMVTSVQMQPETAVRTASAPSAVASGLPTAASAITAAASALTPAASASSLPTNGLSSPPSGLPTAPSEFITPASGFNSPSSEFSTASSEFSTASSEFSTASSEFNSPSSGFSSASSGLSSAGLGSSPSTALPTGLGEFDIEEDEFDSETESEDASSQSPAVL